MEEFRRLAGDTSVWHRKGSEWLELSHWRALESQAMIENSSERWCDEVAFSNLPSWIWGPAQRPVFIFLCERVCSGCRGEPGLAGLHKCLLSQYLLLIYYFLSYRRNLTRLLKFVGFIMALFQHILKWLFFKVFSVRSTILNPSSIKNWGLFIGEYS